MLYIRVVQCDRYNITFVAFFSPSPSLSVRLAGRVSRHNRLLLGHISGLYLSRSRYPEATPYLVNPPVGFISSCPVTTYIQLVTDHPRRVLSIASSGSLRDGADQYDMPSRPMADPSLDEFPEDADSDDKQAIDRARVYITTVRRLIPSSLPAFLHNLSGQLIERYEIRGDKADLLESVDLSREAIFLVNGQDFILSQCQRRLGKALKLLYEHTGDITYLDEVAQVRLASITEHTSAHASQPVLVGNILHQASLVTALLARYQARGSDEGVQLRPDTAREATKTPPIDHVRFPAHCMNQCASLWHNYERYGEDTDLDLALMYISLLVQAKETSPALSQLAHLLRSVIIIVQYGRKGPATLDASLAAARSAVQYIDAATPPSDRSLLWSNLAMCLITRYEQFVDANDLVEGLSYGKRAVDTTSEASPEFHLHLPPMQLAHFCQWKEAKSMKDLEQSIYYGEKAVRHTPATSSARADWMLLLAKGFLALSDIDEDAIGQVERAYAYLKEILRPSSTNATPFTHFDAASILADHAFSHHRPQEALCAYKACYELLPRILRRGNTPVIGMYSSEVNMQVYFGLASRATACAIECGDLTFAFEFAEYGRGAMWIRMREVVPVSDLQGDRERAELADKIQQLQVESKRPGERVDRQLALIHESNKLFQRLQEIQIPNHRDHVPQPPPFDKLRLASRNGPVILLNCSSLRCDALVLPCPTLPIQVVTLLLTSADVETMARSVSDSLVAASRTTVRAGRPSKGGTARNSERVLRNVLTNLRSKVIQPVFSALKNMDIEPQRIWWYPTGTFTALPIHAAMYHKMEPNDMGRESQPESYDHIISSYAPTLSCLLRDVSGDSNKVSVLAVGVPSTPFATPLPAVKDELEHIRTILSESPASVPVPFTILNHDEASIKNVLSSLSYNSWVHLACHGSVSTNMIKGPIDISLILRDGPLRLQELLSIKYLSHARLVILSACETARGVDDMPDETLHISMAMLFLGFRSVIATLWAIDDEDGPMITKDLYAYCFATPLRDDSEERNLKSPVERAPEALHHAVLKMRDQGASLFRWVPFVHIGM
ncbi:hypothetical protein K474DRAFT_1096955 [Panus rudis PR-1116 ss-1]|nr:hypothetical protein K474DRAFT_1096955 [Panus rudis PR-1116 ss-1]